MALMSGSSLNPPDRANAPVQLPANKHKLVHGLANNMVVARRTRLFKASYPQKYQQSSGAPKEWQEV